MENSLIRLVVPLKRIYIIMVDLCPASGCSKSTSVRGLKKVGIKVTCGDAECMGTPTNGFYPNPDAKEIQTINETPGVIVTTDNFNGNNFLPVAEDFKNRFNALCNDEKVKWLSAIDKMTTNSSLQYIKDYCTTLKFKNSIKGRDSILVIYDKNISLADRLYYRCVIDHKRNIRSKKDKANLDKPATSADGVVLANAHGSIKTKREVRLTEVNAKYNSDPGFRKRRSEQMKTYNKEKKEERIAKEIALAEKTGVPELDTHNFSRIKLGAETLFRFAKAQPDSIVLAGASLGGVLHKENAIDLSRTMCFSSKKAMLYALGQDNQTPLSMEVKTGNNIGHYDTVSPHELVRKLFKKDSLVLSRADGTRLRIGKEMVLAYFDYSFLNNTPLLEHFLKKVTNMALSNGLVSVNVLLQHPGAERRSALIAESSSIELSRNYDVIPLEGDASRDGSKSKKTPFVITAAVTVAIPQSSLESGRVFFDRTTATKCFISNVESKVPKNLQRFVDPPLPKKKNSNEYDSDEDSSSEEEEEDSKPESKSNSKVKRKNTSASASTNPKPKKSKQSIPRNKVPEEIRDSKIVPSGTMTSDKLSKAIIQEAVKPLDSVQYSNSLPTVFDAKAKKNLLIILGVGHEDDAKRKAVQEHGLRTMSSFKFAQLIRPFIKSR